MAQIIIEIPDDKLDLIKAWVDSRTNAGILGSWTNAQYAAYVDTYITSKFRAEIRSFQQQQYLQSFVFDDPTLVEASSSVNAATAGTAG